MAHSLQVNMVIKENVLNHSAQKKKIKPLKVPRQKLVKAERSEKSVTNIASKKNLAEKNKPQQSVQLRNEEDTFDFVDDAVRTASSATASKAEIIPVFSPSPVYPGRARRLRLEGTVTVGLVVDNQGAPQKAEVIKSSGYSILDEAAVKALKQWRFKVNNLTYAMAPQSIEVPVRFEMQ